MERSQCTPPGGDVHPSGVTMCPDVWGWTEAEVVAAFGRAGRWPWPECASDRLGHVETWAGPEAGAKVTTGLMDRDQVRDLRVRNAKAGPPADRGLGRDMIVALDSIALDADAADWLVGTGAHATTDAAKASMRSTPRAELDDLLYRHRNVVLSAVMAAGYPAPSRVVHSGYGVHLWWHLDRMISRYDANFPVVQAVGRVMADRINASVGIEVMDTSAVDVGVRRLAIPGRWNRKGNEHRQIRVSGWSDTKVTTDQVDAWVGTVARVDPVSGVTTRVRPAYLGGARSPAIYADLGAPEYTMPDGRTLLAWIDDLTPGQQRTGCPAPRGRDGKNSLTLHREAEGHPWPKWVHDFGRNQNLIHSGVGTTEGDPTRIDENDGLAGIVPRGITNPNYSNATGDNSRQHGVPVDRTPKAPQVAVRVATDRSVDRAATRAIALMPVEVPPPDDDYRFEDAFGDWIAEAVGDTEARALAEGVTERASARIHGSTRIPCTRAPWVHSAASTDARTATSTRLACMAYRCPDCGPVKMATTIAAAQEVVDCILRSPGMADRWWVLREVENVGEDKTLQRWASAAPAQRMYLTVQVTRTTSRTFIFHRKGHGIAPSPTRPSRVEVLLRDAPDVVCPVPDREVPVPARDAYLGRIAEALRAVDITHDSKGEINPIRGRGSLVSTIIALRDQLLQRERRPKSVSDGPRFVSYAKPKEVQRAVEHLAGAKVSTDKSEGVKNSRIGKDMMLRQRWGLGTDPMPVGMALDEVFRSGAVKACSAPAPKTPTGPPTLTVLSGGDDEWPEGLERL